jgi:hypothetical protein
LHAQFSPELFCAIPLVDPQSLHSELVPVAQVGAAVVVQTSVF